MSTYTDLVLERVEADAIEALRDFILDSKGHKLPTRAWLYSTSRIMSIYVRSYDRGGWRWLDLASVDVKPEYQGKGLFRRVLVALEHMLVEHGFAGLRVENVQTEQFARFFRQRAGYDCVDDTVGGVVAERAPWTFIRTFGQRREFLH